MMRHDPWFRPEDGYETSEQRIEALQRAVWATTTLKNELKIYKNKLKEKDERVRLNDATL